LQIKTRNKCGNLSKGSITSLDDFSAHASNRAQRYEIEPEKHENGCELLTCADKQSSASILSKNNKKQKNCCFEWKKTTKDATTAKK
jgi:hypothetical protein